MLIIPLANGKETNQRHCWFNNNPSWLFKAELRIEKTVFLIGYSIMENVVQNYETSQKISTEKYAKKKKHCHISQLSYTKNILQPQLTTLTYSWNRHQILWSTGILVAFLHPEHQFILGIKYIKIQLFWMYQAYHLFCLCYFKYEYDNQQQTNTHRTKKLSPWSVLR